MDVTVNINAPAIVEAINRLSEVFSAALSVNGAQAQSQITAQPQYEVVVPQNAPTQPIQSVQQAEANVTPPVVNAAQTVAQPTQAAPVQQTVQPTQATPIQLTAQPTPIQQTAQPTPAPVVDEAYRNRVCTAAARLVEQGKMSDVLAILQSYGVPAVTHLSATQLPDFAAKIAALGAVI